MARRADVEAWASALRVSLLGAGVAAAASGIGFMAGGLSPLWALGTALPVGLGLWLFGRRQGEEGPAEPVIQPASPMPPAAELLSEGAFDLFDIALVIVDRNLVVIGKTEGARRLFPALTHGRPIALAIRDPDVLAAIEGAAGGEDEQRAIFEERGMVERSWRVRARRIPGSEAGEVAILCEDLTEQRAIERLRVDFVANASHELRTPLASLLGFVETLQGPARNDPAARDRFLAIMREQAARMARLIDDLLSLSRAELRSHQKPAGLVDLASVVREIRDSISHSAAERGVDIVVHTPAAPVTVTGDRDDLLRLAENLIENAVKYGGAGQQVEVTVSAEPSPRLEVRDHGPGIPAAHIPRLTERFYRIDASHSREIGGTGLGLAIVKHIVARHDARFEIVSKPGEGARFSVTFPSPAT